MSESETIWTKTPSSSPWKLESSFSIPNRAMNFGDGVFETMLFDEEKIRFRDLHLKRAKQGLETLGILGKGLDLEEIEAILSKSHSGKKVRVRWNLFRAGSGKYTPENNELSQTLLAEAYAKPPIQKRNSGLCSSVSLHPSSISSLKTLNGLPYILAAQERINYGWDEIILLDGKGNIAEGGASNIFWKKGEIVYTPSLETGCIAGVGRAAILAKFREQGIEIQEGCFSKEELFQAQLVWVSNALGISYLEKIESVEFSPEPWGVLEDIFK